MSKDIVQDEYYGTVSRHAIRQWIKRERENLRDLDAALTSGDWDAVDACAMEVGATGAEIQGRAEAFTHGMRVNVKNA